MRHSRVVSNSTATSSQNDAAIAGSTPIAKAVKVGPTDFELLRVVGQGAFGKVGNS